MVKSYWLAESFRIFRVSRLLVLGFSRRSPSCSFPDRIFQIVGGNLAYLAHLTDFHLLFSFWRHPFFLPSICLFPISILLGKGESTEMLILSLAQDTLGKRASHALLPRGSRVSVHRRPHHAVSRTRYNVLLPTEEAFGESVSRAR